MAPTNSSQLPHSADVRPVKSAMIPPPFRDPTRKESRITKSAPHIFTLIDWFVLVRGIKGKLTGFSEDLATFRSFAH